MNDCRAPTLAVMLLLGLAGCATQSPPRHESQAAPGVDLAGYASFGWQGDGADAAGDEPMRLLDVNIRNAIAAEMTRRGYREDPSGPELRIDYEIAAQDRIRSSPFRIGIGVGSWGGSSGGSVNVGTSSVQTYQEGRLIVHVMDAARNQEVWYGTVTGRIERQSPDAAAVARVVALVMEGFPARTVAADGPR